jgi:hypothetical protein
MKNYKNKTLKKASLPFFNIFSKHLSILVMRDRDISNN